MLSPPSDQASSRPGEILEAYRRLGRRRISGCLFRILVIFWVLGIVVGYQQDEDAETATDSLIREADVEFALAACFGELPKPLRALLWSSTEEEVVEKMSERFESLRRRGLLTGYGESHLEVLQALRSGSSADLPLASWLERGDFSFWQWEYLALKRAGILEREPSLQQGREELLFRAGSSLIAGEAVWWLLALAGLPFLPRALASFRTDKLTHSGKRRGSPWAFSYVFGVFLLVDLVNDFGLFGLYLLPLPWDAAPYLTLITTDTLWRVGGALGMMCFLFVRWRHGARLLGLARRPEWRPVLGMLSLLYFVNLLLYAGWSTLGLPEAEGYVDPWEDGWGGLIYALISGVIMAPVVEEIMFRGFLFRAGYGRFGFLRGAIYSTCFFVLIHFYDVPGSLSVGFFGIAACVLYRATGSLWTGIVFHMAYNAAITASYWPLYHGNYLP
ncbi:MAG: type II CAAX endopeptidase family protein [Verrucomicrobiota bacterium JB023]|nr:type II CAAX endopeptidase family protein [Verrucomicrobiota bacterium JB023]